MKTCTLCKNEKPLSDFNRNARRKDGLQNHCRECGKRHAKNYYRENKSVMIPKIVAKSKERREEFRRRIIEYLQAHPCVDCGEPDIVVLDFDHVRGTKDRHLGKMVHEAPAWSTILSEIEKCEVRCANCHRRKTAREHGYYRYRLLVSESRYPHRNLDIPA